MKRLDSRRLTGVNLIMDGPGAVVDVAAPDAELDAVISEWHARLDRMLPVLGLNACTRHQRRFAGGVSLALTAPIDVLYALCEINEWALEGGDFEAARARLERELERESNPALLTLQVAAGERGVPFLWDDDHVSVGLGVGSRTWPTSDIPSPADVPWTDLHRIPVLMVTGTNGKSTTVRLLAAMVAADGKTPGMSSTDWVRVGDDVVDTGDYSGPGGARHVLRHPQCDVAILETARGGMLRRGLGYDQADAAAVLNVAEDHLGEWGIGDLDGLVDTKFLVTQGVRSSGLQVLNADESPVLARGRELAASNTLWFSVDGTNPQLADAQDAAYVRDGVLCLRRAGVETELVAEAAVPMTFGGAARFNTSNALAAAALAAQAGISIEAIRTGLTSFESDPSRNPGRGNYFELDGVHVVADFAHNPHGTHALFQMAGAFPDARVAVLLGQAGDRTNEDVRGLVEATWAGRPDLIVVKQMAEHLRGRAHGEMVALIDAELARAGVPPERIAHADSELEAAEHALAWAEPGDLLLLLLHAQRGEVLSLLQSRAAAV